VPKPEWGKKRTCQSCGAVFYDLRRKTINCPKCGAAYIPEPPIKGKRAVAPVPAQAPKPAAAKIAAVVSPDDDPDLADEEEMADDDESPAAKRAVAKKGDDDDEELIEDTSDLGEDEDDIGEVKEHIDDGVGDKA
jgi:uncharacterized protein (TIGR02300 family)